MSWISNDYKCSNPGCSKFEQVVEKFGKKEEQDTYVCDGKVIAPTPDDQMVNERPMKFILEPCGELLKRQVSATRGTHVSWSTWRL